MEKDTIYGSKAFVQRVHFTAVEYFGGGIYIDCTKLPKDLIYPSFIQIDGYDFLDLQCMDRAEYQFSLMDISGGIYKTHPLDNLNLMEIFKLLNKSQWAFELGMLRVD